MTQSLSSGCCTNTRVSLRSHCTTAVDKGDGTQRRNFSVTAILHGAHTEGLRAPERMMAEYSRLPQREHVTPIA